MPKIIENLRNQLIEEARRQINMFGYEKTTIRSVAAECGIATGTVYNYFKSKDILVASLVVDDWKVVLNKINDIDPSDKRNLLKTIYDSLISFSESHSMIFKDRSAEEKYYSSSHKWHELLRNQLSAIIEKICLEKDDHEFLSQFTAESILTWSMAGVPFDRIYEILIKII